jgi:hypothetical protein
MLDETTMLETISPLRLANGSPWIAPPDPPDLQLEKVESTTSSCEPCKKNAAPDKVLWRFSNLQDWIKADIPECKYRAGRVEDVLPKKFAR